MQDSLQLIRKYIISQQDALRVAKIEKDQVHASDLDLDMDYVLNFVLGSGTCFEFGFGFGFGFDFGLGF
jgi:hypothetical protein